MSEPDIELAVVQPWVSFCNDSAGTSPEGLLGKEFPHPRAYGTFPRVLRKYVREERRMRLEEAIRKFTSLPASRLRLNDRGVIKAGMWADIVVFDPADHHRALDLLSAESAVGGHAMGAGERRAGDRRRRRDQCAARARCCAGAASREIDAPGNGQGIYVRSRTHARGRRAPIISQGVRRAISNEEPWNRPIPRTPITSIKSWIASGPVRPTPMSRSTSD